MYDVGAQPSVIAIPNPGTGNGATYTVPGSERLTLVAVTFQLATSAVAGTRFPVVRVADGSGVNVAVAVAGFGVPASTTAVVSYVYGLAEWDAATPAAATNFASGPCPLIPLGLGDVVTLQIVSIDAGDALTAIRIGVVQTPVRE